MNKLEREIIAMLFDLSNKKTVDIENLKAKLLSLAQNFNIKSIKKSKAINQNIAIRNFILNGSGYVKTIPDLFNSL